MSEPTDRDGIGRRQKIIGLGERSISKSYYPELRRRLDRLEAQKKDLEEERRKTRESEANYRSVIENIQDVFYRSDARGNLIMASPSFLTLLGYESLAECLEKPIAGTYYYDPEKRAEFLRQILEKGSVTNFEVVLKRRDGAPVTVETNSHLYFDEDGNVAGVEGTFRDITARKRADEALRASEQQMKAIVDGSPIPQFVIDKNHRIIHWNRALEEYSGIRAEDVVGTDRQWRAFYDHERPCMADLIVDGSVDLIARWYMGYSQSRLIENAFEATDFFPAMKGGIWLYFTAAPIYSDSGSIIGAVETLVDITERKRAKDALEESRRELETLLSNLPGMAYRCRNDKEWTMSFVSEGCHALTGYTPDDLMNSRRISYNEIIHPEDREAVWNQVQKALERRTHFRLNYRIVTAEGEVRWVWEQGAGVYSPAGELVFLEGFIADITERRRAEEVLRLNAERLDTLLMINQMADATHQEIMDFGFEEAIRLTKSKIGYLGLINEDETVMTVQVWSRNVMPDCDIAGSTLAFPLPEAGLWAEAVRQRRPIITNDCSAANPWKKGYPEGHLKIMRHMNVPVFVGQRIVLLAGVGNKEEEYDETDIRQLTLLMEGMWRLIERKQAEGERRKLETQLIQAQKMEAVGTLAGGIAHDFNNILSGIMGYAELCLKAVPDRPKVLHNMEQVLKAAERAKDLVRQILTFSRKTEHDKKPIALSYIVKDVVKFMRASLPTTIEIIQKINVISDVITADTTQMHQVLMNLCTNAGHSMKETGGVLEVGLNEVVINAQNILHRPPLRHGRYLELSVRDTGHGISQENLGRIFEPYYTTKGKGEGTGLGLAVVHGIVKDHGGEIRVYSEVGKGSIFRVYLPLVEKQEEYRADEEEHIFPGQGEKILFVDDEEMVVDLNKELLEGLGYRVFAETDPLKAIEAFRKDSESFDLVITDKTMPHMTGFDVAQEIRNIRPEIPVVICSGFYEKEDMEKLKDLTNCLSTTKPVRMNVLAKTVRDALGKAKAEVPKK